MKKLFLFLIPACLAYSDATLNLSPVTTLSSTTGNSTHGPSLAIAENGQSIVVWTEGIVEVQASSFRSGAWVTINPINEGALLTDPWASIDANGNAVATWVNRGTVTIQASTLAATSIDWFMPVADISLGGGTFPRVATAPSGLTYAMWNDLVAPTQILSVSLQNFTTNTWSTPPDTVQTNASDPYQLIIDPFLTPFATYLTTANGIEVSKKDPTWSAFPSFASTTSSGSNLGFDSAGNAIAIWYDTTTDTFIKYSLFTAGSWGPELFVSPTGTGVSNPLPVIAVDANGNAVAVWNQLDGGVTRVFASTYNGTTWSTPIPISAPGNETGGSPISLSIDANGDAIAVWPDTTDGGTTVVVEAAFLPFGSNTWQLRSLSSTATGANALNPQIDINPNGDVVIAWVFIDNSTGFSYIQAVTGFIVQVPPPPSILPPSSISGVKNENRFLFQSEFFNIIRWGASPSANVVSYKIYRNGSLIATVGSNTLSYTDHLRSENGRDVYGVSSVNSSGDESSQIQVTVQ